MAAAALTLSLSGVVATSAPAHAAVADNWGFALSQTPSPGGTYIPDTNHQWGSWKVAFPGAWATVTQLGGIGSGRYQVLFPQLFTVTGGGVAHATAFGSPGGQYCTVESFGPALGGENVNVDCFKPGGAPFDSAFTVLWTESSAVSVPAGQAYSYLFANLPTTPVYTPTDQYNSAFPGGPPSDTVSHGGTGVWKAFLPSVGSPTALAGNVQVTAVGRVGAWCKLALWSPTTTGQSLVVQCFNALGNPVDIMWTLSYTLQRPVIGSFAPPKLHAYTINTMPTNATPFPGYTPAPPAIDFDYAGIPPTVYHLGPGLHQMTFPVIGQYASHAQVTGYGRTNAYCTLLKLADYQTVFTAKDLILTVGCYKPAGTPVDDQSIVATVSTA